MQFSGKKTAVLRCEIGKRENIINIGERVKVIRVKRINEIVHDGIRDSGDEVSSKKWSSEFKV
jgi:hypothetical protein